MICELAINYYRQPLVRFYSLSSPTGKKEVNFTLKEIKFFYLELPGPGLQKN